MLVSFILLLNQELYFVLLAQHFQSPLHLKAIIDVPRILFITFWILIPCLLVFNLFMNYSWKYTSNNRFLVCYLLFSISCNLGFIILEM